MIRGNIYKIQNSFFPVVDEIFKSLDKLLTKSYDNSKPIKGFYPSPQPGYMSLTHDTYYFYIKDKKNDNQIHMELLKNNEPLSKENYMDYLFGPDHRLINYDFQ